VRGKSCIVPGKAEVAGAFKLQKTHYYTKAVKTHLGLVAGESGSSCRSTRDSW
jgi:hypothetical protein